MFAMSSYVFAAMVLGAGAQCTGQCQDISGVTHAERTSEAYTAYECNLPDGNVVDSEYARDSDSYCTSQGGTRSPLTCADIRTYLSRTDLTSQMCQSSIPFYNQMCCEMPRECQVCDESLGFEMVRDNIFSRDCKDASGQIIRAPTTNEEFADEAACKAAGGAAFLSYTCARIEAHLNTPDGSTDCTRFGVGRRDASHDTFINGRCCVLVTTTTTTSTTTTTTLQASASSASGKALTAAVVMVLSSIVF